MFKGYGNDSRCLELRVLEEAKSSEYVMLYKEIVDRIDSKTIYQDEYAIDEPESLKKEKKRSCGKSRRSRKYRSRPCRRVVQIINAFKEDIVTIWELTTRVTTRHVNLPNLDGLYGGKACKTMDGGEIEANKKSFYVILIL